MLRGNQPAKIDDKGRLKIPNGFRAAIQDTHGRALFVTSLTGESVRLYPMPVWEAIEQQIARMGPIHPSRQRFLARVNFFGQVTEFDQQGRVVIPQRLRDTARITGDVDVLGQQDHLEVWNHDRFVARMESDPFTDEDARALAELWPPG
ncbi:MAG: hypothetical protein R2712_14780 [Vicinamibacterales bacterium]